MSSIYLESILIPMRNYGIIRVGNMHNSLRNIYLIGMMGVGKSTVGIILANRLKWAFVDVNEMLEAIYNRSLLEISETFGEESLRNMEGTMLQELSQGEHQVFACNSDSVLEESKMRTMDTNGVTIWIDTPVADLVERMESKEIIIEAGGKPGNILEEMLEDRRVYYEQANIRVANDNLSPEMTVEEIIKALNLL